MATQDVHAPTLGAQGEPCATCGSPLAADQRYCLQCGARRAEARIAFREILAPPPQAVVPPPGVGVPAVAPADEPPQRSGPAFLAGLLCLLLALGVGVLIGRSGNDTPTAAAPAPAQVITVGGSAPAAAATTPTTTTPAAGSTDTSGSSTKSAKDSGAAKSSKSSKATNKSVKSLNSASGSDYQKKSQKLPKQVGTGGKPPAKDNRPAGGGSGFQSIG
jgi:hypothetical protein